MNSDKSDEMNEKTHFQLKEGEEVSLGLPAPAERIEAKNYQHDKVSEDANEHHQIKKINFQEPKHYDQGVAPHAAGDLMSSLSEEEKKQLEEEVQTHPKINLAPDVLIGEISKDKNKSKLERLKEIRKHRYWHEFKLIFGTVLVFVLLFNSQWFISQFMYVFSKPKAQQVVVNQNDQNKTSNQEEKKSEAEIVGPQNEIIIPKINVTAPIIYLNTYNEPDVLVALRDGVVHYYGTANPGDNGNAVFFGHSSNDWWEPGNYKFVFVLLEKMSVGDTYEIHYNSRKYVYQVTETKVVQPNDLSVLNQTSEPYSTLITCTPPGTSWQRFIVTGKQITPQPTKVVNKEPAQSQKPVTTQKELPSAAPSLWEQIKSFFGPKDKTKSEDSQPANQEIKHLPEVN